MENLEIYEAVRTVPQNAQKIIGAGRLKGMTDINPMWRIKTLTEQFGPCGFGWKYIITDKHMEAGAGGEMAAFVDIDLYIKVNGEWSDPIPGTGGSSFVASERTGLHTSDECYKMALTDAISVACKCLGMGADIYWDKDKTKYTNPSEAEMQKFVNDYKESVKAIICQDCKLPILPREHGGKKYSAEQIKAGAMKKYGMPLCWGCMEKRKQ